MAKKPDTLDRVQAQVDELKSLLEDIGSRLMGRPDGGSEDDRRDRVIDLRDQNARQS